MRTQFGHRASLVDGIDAYIKAKEGIMKYQMLSVTLLVLLRPSQQNIYRGQFKPPVRLLPACKSISFVHGTQAVF